MDPGPPQYFHKDGSGPSCLVGWRGRERRGPRESEARPHFTRTGVGSSHSTGPSAPPSDPRPATPRQASVGGFVSVGTTPRCSRRPPSSRLNRTPEAICLLPSCCRRVQVGDRRPWTGGQTGSKVGRVRPGSFRCFRYSLIQKSTTGSGLVRPIDVSLQLCSTT